MAGLPPVPSASLMSPQQQAAYNPSVSPQPSPVPPFGSSEFPVKKGTGPANSQAMINQLVRKEYERSLGQIELPKGPAQDIYFIPSANQMEFLMCLGLEEVVKCVHEQMSAKQAREREKAEKEKAEKENGGGGGEIKREAGAETAASKCVEIQYKYPLICASCSTDWTPVWRKDKNGVVLCDRCLKITERKQIKSEHNARLKQAFTKAAKDKEQFEKQLQSEKQAASAAAAVSTPPTAVQSNHREHGAAPLAQQAPQRNNQQPRNSPQIVSSNNNGGGQRNATPGSVKPNNAMYSSPHLNSHSSNNNYLTPNTSSSNSHHHHHNSSAAGSRHPTPNSTQQQQQQRSGNRMPMEQSRQPSSQSSTPKNVNPGNVKPAMSAGNNPRMNQNHHMTPPNAGGQNKGNKVTPNADMQQQRQRQNNNSSSSSSMNHHHSSSPSAMHQGGSNSLKSSSSQSNLANNSSSQAAMIAAFQQQLAAMQGGAAAAAAANSSSNPLLAFAQQQQQQNQLLRLMAQSPNYNPLLAGFQSNQAAQQAFNYLNSMSAPVPPKQWKP